MYYTQNEKIEQVTDTTWKEPIEDQQSLGFIERFEKGQLPIDLVKIAFGLSAKLTLRKKTDLLGEQFNLSVVIRDQRVGGVKFLVGGIKLGLERIDFRL